MVENYISAVEKIAKICEARGFKTEYNKASEIRNEMGNFRLKVMFSGSFSAGKSTAINSILGREILVENIDRETAIATEVVYDKDEYIEAVVASETNKRFEIGSSEAIDPTRFEYLIYHINCDAIKRLERFTIVDMPGYNSGIINHNKAILRYAGRGNAYILTIDCEDGSVKESLCAFMEEIRNYDNNVAVALTKTDKKPPNDVKMISESVLSTAHSIFGQDVELVTISKYDETSGKKLVDVIEQFDYDNIFCQTFKPCLLDLGSKCIFGLSGLKKGLSLNENEINREIEKRRENMEDLQRQLDKEKKRLSSEIRNNVLENILSDARNALVSQCDTLTAALISGGDSFSINVNNILRGVLVSSTKNYVEHSFSNFAQNLDLSAFECNIDSGSFDTNEASAKLHAIQNGITKLAATEGVGGAIYKSVVGALAITTTVIAPWLEIVILFIPDILKLISGIVGRSSETKKREEAKRKLVNEIIPQIISKLSPEIIDSLEEIKNDMINEVADSVNERMRIEIDGMNDAKNRLEANRKNYDDEIRAIDADIECINAALNAL